jgi:ankyrin repeat protein
MKYVREHINEKFTDSESDPIIDMGIGLLKQLKDDYKNKKHYSYSYSHNNQMVDPTLDQLLVFCMNNHVYPLSTIKYLLDAGADPNIKGSWNAPFTNAVNRGIDYVKLFIEKGVKLKSAIGSDAFIAAVYNNKLDIAQLLLDKGVNIHGRGDLALRQSIRYSSKNQTTKWLLERGAYANTHDYYVLQKALKYKDYDLVDILVKKYAEDRKI